MTGIAPVRGTIGGAKACAQSKLQKEFPMAKVLERFTIARAADGYLLTIEDEGGDTIEMTATFDQMDMIAEELDAALDEDADDMTEIDDDAPDGTDDE
jgi:hypothetical protein